MKSLRQKISNSFYLTDGGLETDLIFHRKIDLPHFAAFPLLMKPQYFEVLLQYYSGYMDIAKEYGAGFILESPTWRANRDWAFKLGFDIEDLKTFNNKAVRLMEILKEKYSESIADILISGQLGPRGDGYQIETKMTVEQARKYHSSQIQNFKMGRVDMVSAITMTYTEEAIGIALSAQKERLPVVISFTVETDGKLPSGNSLQEAIREVDQATDTYPSYYMINCAHPSHFSESIKDGHGWQSRIMGVRTNASCKSHEELDQSTEIDIGDIKELGKWHKKLQQVLPKLRVYGGCCGTDTSHIKSICEHISLPTKPLKPGVLHE